MKTKRIVAGIVGILIVAGVAGWFVFGHRPVQTEAGTNPNGQPSAAPLIHGSGVVTPAKASDTAKAWAIGMDKVTDPKQQTTLAPTLELLQPPLWEQVMLQLQASNPTKNPFIVNFTLIKVLVPYQTSYPAQFLGVFSDNHGGEVWVSFVSPDGKAWKANEWWAKVGDEPQVQLDPEGYVETVGRTKLQTLQQATIQLFGAAVYQGSASHNPLVGDPNLTSDTQSLTNLYQAYSKPSPQTGVSVVNAQFEFNVPTETSDLYTVYQTKKINSSCFAYPGCEVTRRPYSTYALRLKGGGELDLFEMGMDITLTPNNREPCFSSGYVTNLDSSASPGGQYSRYLVRKRYGFGVLDTSKGDAVALQLLGTNYGGADNSTCRP